jgi:hypothetical protein
MDCADRSKPCQQVLVCCITLLMKDCIYIHCILSYFTFCFIVVIQAGEFLFTFDV